MLAPGNYVQWKSIIKRYIDTKPNHELIHYCLTNPSYELGWIDKEISISEGSPITRSERFRETYKNVLQEIRDQLNAKAEAVQIILTGIDNDIYSTVDACSNACEMWKAIERLKQCESINVQDLETNLYWEFGKFTSQDEWQRFVTLVKQNQELKTVSYHKLYDILKQHQHEVNEIRAERIARVANLLVRVAQQQPVYHPQTHPTHYTQNSSTRSQQAATRNRGKEIVNSPKPIYDQEPSMVVEDDETANQDNSPRINRSAGYENQRIGNVAGARETVGSTTMQKSKIQCYNCKEFGHVARECHKPKRAKDAAYHRENILLCKQEEAGIQLNAEQADWRDDTDDNELEDQELEAHYIKHHEQSESVHDTYPIDQDAHNVIIDSLDLSYDREEIDQNDDDNDLAKEPPESGEVIRLKKESRSKLSDLIRPFDYNKLNNLYDLFVPQREKSSEQRYFSERSRLSHTSVNNENSKETFNKQTTLLEKRMDESISLDKKTYSGYIDPFIQKTIESKFSPVISRINAGLEQFYRCLNEEMVADLRYFNSLELEVDSLRSQLETQKTQFLNEIDRLSREYYYADHMNAILGVYTELDEVTNLQCDYLKLLEKCEGLETELSKSKIMSKFFKALQKHAINLEIDLQQCQEKIKNDKSFTENLSKEFRKEREQYFKIQDLKAHLQDKGVVIRVILTTSFSRPQLKSNPMGDSVLHNNSQGKKQDVEDHHRSVNFSKNKTSVTECNDSMNAKTLNVNSLVEIVLFIVDSGCSKHMTGNRKLLINFVEKFLGTVKFGNDQIAPILGYGDLVQRAVTIKRVYYVKGLNHNLFSVGQFCDADLEVAFRKSTCFIRDLKGNDLLTDDETSQDKEIDKLMALISLSFKKIYKPTNNNLRTSSNTSRANQDNYLRINRSAGYENQRICNVAGAREIVGSTTMQKSKIQCYNCKEFGHVARECHKPKRAKDAAYHRENMLLCKQEEARIQLNAEQADWRDDTDDDKLEDQDLEAHYIKHHEQYEFVHDTYPIDQDAHNVIIDSLDLSYDREEIDQNDDDNDLAKE
nr:integrase, catalytic region, zinc finger, CCHC-type, peptidase aspartic, catalytic [Tanacetum cinerariifolium]